LFGFFLFLPAFFQDVVVLLHVDFDKGLAIEGIVQNKNHMSHTEAKYTKKKTWCHHTHSPTVYERCPVAERCWHGML
jgi:hypothetical protein